MEKYTIVTTALTKKFNGLTAVDKVSMKIGSGQIYALIGPNGAGKTTLIKMLVGLLKPTQGQVFINGFDLERNPDQAKKSFGYIPDDYQLYEYMTGEEFIMFTARLRGIDRIDFDRRYKKLSALFPIQNILKTQMQSYSRGSLQKTAFLAALIADPQVLFIDEPVVGLDPESMQIFGDTLQSFANQNKTVFFVSHIMSFTQKYARRVAVMKDGAIIEEKNVSKNTSL